MSRTYRFADFCIDPDRRELWRGGQLVSLPPQVFDFLAYLIERNERAVGRDELVAAVWGKTEVSDTLLGQTVLRLRRELGDDAKQQRMLRTIARFGYRWVAPLDMADDPPRALSSEAAQIGTIPAARSTRGIGGRTRSRAALFIAAVLVFAVLALLAVTWRTAAKPASTPAVNVALSSVVLPAEVESSAQWAWTRLGVMDMVASRLRSAGVPSVPSEQVVAFLNTPGNRGATIRDVTATRVLIAPRVQRIGDAWHVNLDADGGTGRADKIEDLMNRQGQLHDALESVIADFEEILPTLQPASE